MPYKTISLSIPAYERLRGNKHSGDSFSDVVLREVEAPVAGWSKEEILRRLAGPPVAVDAAYLHWLDTYDRDLGLDEELSV